MLRFQCRWYVQTNRKHRCIQLGCLWRMKMTTLHQTNVERWINELFRCRNRRHRVRPDQSCRASCYPHTRHCQYHKRKHWPPHYELYYSHYQDVPLMHWPGSRNSYFLAWVARAISFRAPYSLQSLPCTDLVIR